MSKKNRKKIGINILFFSLPTGIVIFLTAYSQGLDVVASLITASISFLNAVIDFGKKYAEEHTAQEDE